MPRQVLGLFVLLALLWQSVAAAGTGAWSGALSDQHHAALHWLGTDHHHHDDGTYHDDDSGESRRHLNADNAVGSPALPCAVLACAMAPAHQEVRVAGDAALPQPYLDGLLRPPRTHL